jgi:hypothetical protein
MIVHPALITVNIAERERELVRRGLRYQEVGRQRRSRSERRRRRRLRDLFRRPRPAAAQRPLRTSAPWQP